MSLEKLSQFALLKISGNDAGHFLQGQLSNDIEQLKQSWQLSGYCSPKGRLLALFYIWKNNDVFYALLDNSLLEPISKRLSMFVLRSKVSIEHVSQASVIGSLSLETLQQHPLFNKQTTLLQNLRQKNHSPRQLLLSEDFSILNLGERYLIVANEDTDIQLKSSQQWQKTDILEGIAHINHKNSDLFVPQMLNLDLLNAINFKKGCYTGQEIIARMHYLGKLKQRMFVCDIISNDTPECLPGDKVYTDQELNKSAGTLVNIDHVSKKLLAVLRLEFANSDTIFYLQNKTKFKIASQQPYSLPN